MQSSFCVQGGNIVTGSPLIKFDRDTPRRRGLTRLGHELRVPPITAHLCLLYALNRNITCYPEIQTRSLALRDSCLTQYIPDVHCECDASRLEEG
jgi:hypothetical protein